ncbi:hypothetical protein [uncultured Nitratireductor sp.]|uniref:hypothetical protein n=1 Tax=uncultured Nitratireductor sp. TaxID=520953 RepID=UPI0025D641A7|nr:hypothetical protein [uncultured Nitratireductor sp.]
MRGKIAAIALVGVLVAGCQTTSNEPLPSNSFTFNSSKQVAKEAIVSTYMSRGFNIVRDSDLQLVMDRPASDNFGAQLVFGSNWNSVPNARITATLLGDNPTNITVRQAIVTNPGTGFERVMDLSQNPSARQQLQIGMSRAKSMAESTANASSS